MASHESTSVIIVGAGIAGVCAAVALTTSSVKYDITILEQSEAVSEVGAGVQISPNWTRLLYSWDLKSKLERYAVEPGYSTICRWQDGSVIARVKTNDEDHFVEQYGYPLHLVHRADLLRVLLEKARQAGVTVRTGSRVSSFEPGAEPASNTVCLETGAKLSADLVIGADGAKSTINHFVAGDASPPSNVGDSAYRALLPTSLLEESDRDLFRYGKASTMKIWIGPDSHVVTYLVRNEELLNMVILVPDSIEPGAEENWKQKGNVEKLRQFFNGWDPSLRRLLRRIEESYLWRLRDRSVLQQWLHDTANLVLIGDSAHPMLPYAASGAACCAEDAAILAACLERVGPRDKLDIRGALKAYQELRVQRATEMVSQSKGNRGNFHLHDGPQQEARDKKIGEPGVIAASMAGLHSYDAIKEVEKYFEQRTSENSKM